MGSPPVERSAGGFLLVSAFCVAKAGYFWYDKS